MKYVIDVVQYWYQTTEIEADSLEAAVDKINAGEGEKIGSPRFIQTDEDCSFWKHGNSGKYIDDLLFEIQFIESEQDWDEQRVLKQAIENLTAQVR